MFHGNHDKIHHPMMGLVAILRQTHISNDIKGGNMYYYIYIYK